MHEENKCFLSDRTSIEVKQFTSKKDGKIYDTLVIESPKYLKEQNVTVLVKNSIFLKDWDIKKIVDYMDSII